MELHQVRYYVALCRTLNFTRAAEACNVTQPALTRAIQKLEEELGGPLFRRERSLTQLTELGRLMRPLLEQTLAAAQSAKEHATRFRKSEVAVLRLGLPPTISARVLLSSLRELTRRLPHLEVELKMADDAALIDVMLQGEVDLAFLSPLGPLPERLHTWPLFKEGFRVAFGEGHRLAALDAITPASLDGEVLLARRGCAATLALRDRCVEAGVKLPLRHLCDSEEHLQQLAASGLGIALLPQHLPVLSSMLTRPLREPPLERSVVLATVSRRRYSPSLDAFIKLARTRDFAAELAIA
ncbi:MAG: LysR family transcriptional regulator [Stellaceae bacterium]